MKEKKPINTKKLKMPRPVENLGVSDDCIIDQAPAIEGAWYTAALVGSSKGASHSDPIRSPLDAVNLLRPLLTQPVEHAYAILLRDDDSPYGIVAMGHGDEFSVMPSRSDLARAIVVSGSKRVIFVHNHPSGNPKLSNEDIHLASTLSKGLDLLGVRLEDMIALGATEFDSLVQRGTFEDIDQ